ncbi:glycosyltransferase [Micromonospora sp. NPDC050980]|uniref:glycosyltransferase n=1 Tax=Micromonospora sp. NPDC050980 TaxID=3155161 RepID=UPI0033DEDD88
MTSPRILVAGNFHWNAGSSHMIAEYARVADTVGCEIGVSTQLARMDPQVPTHLPLVDDVGWATHLVVVFEGRQFLTDQQLELCERIPRHRRLVVDPDGHWGPFVSLGPDDNASGYSHASWSRLYTQLADVVLQPRVDGSLPAGAEYFPYFGMPAIVRLATDAPPADQLAYELQYVGNNWWRWTSLTDVVKAALVSRPPLSRMRVCGRWWDGEACTGHEAASRSERGWLARHGVLVAPSLPFGQVVTEMSRSAITPLLTRPLLTHLGLLTPRMFETLASGSVPVLASNLAYLTKVYGDEALELLFGPRPTDLLERIRREPLRYRRLVTTIQRRAFAAFNYEQVLTQLLKFLQ